MKVESIKSVLDQFLDRSSKMNSSGADEELVEEALDELDSLLCLLRDAAQFVVDNDPNEDDFARYRRRDVVRRLSKLV